MDCYVQDHAKFLCIYVETRLESQNVQCTNKLLVKHMLYLGAFKPSSCCIIKSIMNTFEYIIETIQRLGIEMYFIHILNDMCGKQRV